MARNAHKVYDDFSVTLAEDIDSDDTEFDVETGQGATLTGLPCYLKFRDADEQIEVTAVVGDTVTAVRGVNGTAGAPHFTGDEIESSVVAGQIDELHDELLFLHAVLYRMAGGGDGVLRDAQVPTFLKVVAQDTPDMTVKVQAGIGFAGGYAVHVDADYTTAAIVAPTGGSAGDLRRIDVVQISQWDAVTIKTGVEDASPVAPAVDSGCLKLAEIHCRKGMTVIKNTDDASNGWIVNSEVYV